MSRRGSALIGAALFVVAVVPPVAVLAPPPATAGVGIIAFLLLIAGYGRQRGRVRPQATPDIETVRRVERLAEGSRRLAIYDQETALLAHWYFDLRAREECSRAGRYRHELSLLLADIRDVERDPWTERGRFAAWIGRHTRSCDISTCLGSGRYAILMPETGPQGASTVADRVRRQPVDVAVSVASFPRDGSTFEALYRQARERLEAEREADASGDGARVAIWGFPPTGRVAPGAGRAAPLHEAGES